MRKLILLFPVIFSLFFLINCTTTKGNLFSKIVLTETKQTKNKTEEKTKENSNEEQKGLKIITHPDNADIYINNKYMGQTPLLIPNLEKGSYKLTIEKDGYYTKTVWLDYNGTPLTYETDLKQIIGYLSINVIPSNSIIEVDDKLITEGLTPLPVGVYQLTVKSFGYKKYKKQITITPDTVTNLNIKLERAVFNVSEISSDKESFNPRNPGLLGTIEFSFEVTSWGTGNIKIYTKSGNLVFTESLKQFNTWHQTFRWNGRSKKGNIVPDGLYHFVLTAESLNGKKIIKRGKYIRVDSSLIISLRNLWSGSSGLMYAETADVLPPLDFQLSMLSIGHSENINGSNYFRFPSILSIRVGLGSDFELGASGALIFENSDTTPFNFSLFLKKLILKKNLSILTLSMAGTLKLAYQGNTETDIFTNPGGASLSLPLSLSMGLFHILYSPEVVVSYYRVIYPYSTSTTATTTLLLYSWMYHRMGILLDYGFLTGGLSLALRSTPFNYITLNRFRVLEPPFQTAMELNFMIPKTRAFVSLLVTAEIESTNSYYISGGIGLSYLY